MTRGTKAPRNVRLILVGFGNVGRDLATLLIDEREELARQHGVAFSIVSIITGHHGGVVAQSGVDLRWALDRTTQPTKQAPSTGCNDGQLGPHLDPLSVIRTISADVVVELTPLDVNSGQPAISYIEAALEQGKHVVTANKGPIAFAYQRLNDLARASDRKLLFESTVLDGTPVFNLARHCLSGTRVTGFRGILNSTTNFILEQFEQGNDLAGAVRVAQQRGFAEADPGMDIDGWDAAAKTAALANVLLRANITPADVQRTGIRNITPEQVARAHNDNKCIKLLCEASFELAKPGTNPVAPARVKARVAPVEVDRSDLLAQVHGTSSLLTLSTKHMGDITLIENDPSLLQTAYGVLNDLLEIVAGETQWANPATRP